MNITQALHRNLQLGADRPMTICGDRTHTTRQFVDRVARLAGALQQLGMRPGDRVAMLGLNSDRYVEHFFAVPWGDGVLNPCNIRWSAKENAYALNDSETAILIVDEQFKAMAAELQREVEVAAPRDLCGRRARRRPACSTTKTCSRRRSRSRTRAAAATRCSASSTPEARPAFRRV